MADAAPFFIVGASRSGTTLLRLILCGHPRLHIPPETRFLTALLRELPAEAPLSAAQVARAVAIMLAEDRWQDLAIAPDALRAEVARLASPRLADIAGVPYRLLLARAGKPRFGDKTPHYIEIVPRLAALWPDARFIHLIRDGRDVALSFVRAGFHGRPWHGARFEWTAAMRHARHWRRSPLAGRMLDVRYEELAADPEATTRRICDFLGESFTPAMLALADPDALLPARERWLHGKLRQPISREAGESWRALPALQCFVLEAALQRDLRALGYGLRFAGPLWRPALVAAGWLLRALAPLLDRVPPALRRRGLLTAGWKI